MRELREFREHHPEYRAAGVAVAGVSANTIEQHRTWTERLHLPFPLLADPERSSARALGLTRTLNFGPWKVELMRRTTLLIDSAGRIAAVWGSVKIRGHAERVLMHARALQRTA